MKRLHLYAFTLMELLVVMAIIAGLMGILLPALVGAGKTVKTANAAALIRSISTACESYLGEYGFYPPESLAQNDGGYSRIDTPAESLYFFLTRKFVYKSDERNFNERHASTAEYNLQKATVFSTKSAGAYLQINSNGARDFDGDGIPGLIDPWGQPILYNTLGGPYGDAANSNRPFHNTTSYDLFSVGANGTSRQGGTFPDMATARNNRFYAFDKWGINNYASWTQNFLNNTAGGNDTQGQGCNEMTTNYTDKDRDDINNWNYK